MVDGGRRAPSLTPTPTSPPNPKKKKEHQINRNTPTNKTTPPPPPTIRTSHPFVYDMTIAFPGYSGQAPSAVEGGLLDSFLRFCNGEGPKDVHIRLKRYQLVSGFWGFI